MVVVESVVSLSVVECARIPVRKHGESGSQFSSCVSSIVYQGCSQGIAQSTPLALHSFTRGELRYFDVFIFCVRVLSCVHLMCSFDVCCMCSFDVFI